MDFLSIFMDEKDWEYIKVQGLKTFKLQLWLISVHIKIFSSVKWIKISNRKLYLHHCCYSIDRSRDLCIFLWSVIQFEAFREKKRSAFKIAWIILQSRTVFLLSIFFQVIIIAFLSVSIFIPSSVRCWCFFTPLVLSIEILSSWGPTDEWADKSNKFFEVFERVGQKNGEFLLCCCVFGVNSKKS